MKFTNCLIKCMITPATESRPEDSVAVMFVDAPLTFPNDNPVKDYIQAKSLVVADDKDGEWKWIHVSGIEKIVITQELLNNEVPHWKWYWCTIKIDY